MDFEILKPLFLIAFLIAAPILPAGLQAVTGIIAEDGQATAADADNINFEVVNILPTSPQYEGVSSCVSCNGQECCSSVWGCPNLWGVVRIGNASIDPNVWGWQSLYLTDPQQIGTGNSTMWIENGVLHVDSRWTINATPEYNVMAYHEVIYGAKPWGNQPVNAPNFQLPMMVSDLPRILVGVEYYLESGVPGNNFAFEAWLFPDANNGRSPGPGDYEIMVQLYIEGGFPAGYDQGPVATFTVPLIVNGTLVNQTFELYDVVADAGWRFLTFKSTTNYVNVSVVFDYTYFIELADQYLGGVLDNLHLMSLEFGTEVYTNECPGYPCNVDIRWQLSNYYYALAPRSTSPWEAMEAWLEQQEQPGQPPTQPTPPPSQPGGAITISYPEEQWPTAIVDLDNDSIADYVIEINPWNIESADGQAVMTYYLGNMSLHYAMNLDNIVLRNPGAWVHGYPEIYYGNKPWNTYNATDGPVTLPGRLDQLNNFYVTVSYNLNPQGGLPVNLAIESWLTREAWRSTGVNPDEQELMIWLYYQGLQPAGSKIGEIVVPIVVNGTPVNATFEVWKAFIGWEYVAFRITTPIKAGTITLPYAPFISTAANITDLQDYQDLYLEDVEVGTEFGSPSTTSAVMEWWITGFNLTPTDEPILTTPPPPPEEPPQPPETPPSPPGGGVAENGTINVTIVNTWGSGAQYEVQISLDRASDWLLLVRVADGSLVDVWGAEETGVEDGYIVLKNEEWNRGPEASVGFITQGSNPLVEEILLVVNGTVLDNWTAPQPEPGSLQATLVIESQWDTGFVAKIILTNTGTTPIASWYVEILMTSSITSIWGAEATPLDGGVLLLTPVDYTSVIQPGQSVEIGFVAQIAGDHPFPEIVDYGVSG